MQHTRRKKQSTVTRGKQGKQPYASGGNVALPDFYTHTGPPGGAFTIACQITCSGFEHVAKRIAPRRSTPRSSRLATTSGRDPNLVVEREVPR